MIKILSENPLLLFFLVSGVGFAVGRLRVKGFSLGSAAVLFAGLAVGAVDPALKLPEFVYQLGLVLFVYTIALSSGPGLKRTFSRIGLRDNAFAILVLIFGAAVTLAMHHLFKIRPGHTAGLYAGSLTNTPALAAVLDSIKSHAAASSLEAALNEPVFAYSVSYPFGVIGLMLAIWLAERRWKIDYEQEALRINDATGGARHLVNMTVLVTRPDAEEKTLLEIRNENRWRVLFGRIRRGDETFVFQPEVRVRPGDLLTVVGDDAEIKKAMEYLGKRSDLEADLDHSILDYRRIFVSNKDVAEHTLHQLNVTGKFGGIVTRVRRGDIDFLPHRNTVLELGDRVRVLAPRRRMKEITQFFGDSYKNISEIDLISFSLGIAAGLVLGLIPVPLPNGETFRLGLAGGPLIAGLFLGIRGRTGQLVWQLPYSANLTLRQIGLVLFLAGVGTRSGYGFASSVAEGQGLNLLISGGVVTFSTAMLALIIGYKVFKIPMSILTGMAAAMNTQPAVLAFANERTDYEFPNVGYATVYPISMITKIVIAPLLLSLAAG